MGTAGGHLLTAEKAELFTAAAVSKITPDAVYFKENVLDANGRLTTHEVMKRLTMERQEDARRKVNILLALTWS